jgi:hypothetical protein
MVSLELLDLLRDNPDLGNKSTSSDFVSLLSTLHDDDTTLRKQIVVLQIDLFSQSCAMIASVPTRSVMITPASGFTTIFQER